MAKGVHLLSHFSRNGNRQGTQCFAVFLCRVPGLGAAVFLSGQGISGLTTSLSFFPDCILFHIQENR